MSRPYDSILAIDFETYWHSGTYTLSKMTTEEYIRDEKFKVFGACIKYLDKPGLATWYTGEALSERLAGVDWSRTAVLAHNAQFDVSILEWVYDCHPCFIFDTLSMARALRGVEVGNSLAKLAEDFCLPPKGRAVHSTDGLKTLTPEIDKELGEYCAHDVFLCEEIFKRLVKGYPSSELRLIDMTLKMYTRPLLVLDAPMLMDAIDDERTKREELLTRLNVDDKVLASNPKFASLLADMGCAIPYKTSKTTGKQTLALAKNDALFQALLNGEREDVSLVCEARLKVKSTTERTRAQRFLDISTRGTLPVPLSYYGALSGRWTASKGSAINMQNLKRGSFLRKAIMAPEGHALVVGDLSQIEPRVLAWLSDYDDLLDIFRAGGDAYATFGAQMFNIPGLTKDSHPDLRQSAKSALLGCFGADTLVLTQRGWTPIVRVQATDTVWDGEAWVKHQGVVPQGEKEVLTQYGISATSDHEILTGHGWAAWSEVLANPFLLKSGLLLANLPASGGNDDRTVQNGKTSLLISQECVAHVGGKALSSAPTCGQEEQRGAMTAQKRKQHKHAWLLRGMKQFVRIGNTATDYSTESAPSLVGVRTRTTAFIQTTAVVASQYILHGLNTALSFCDTLFCWTVGTNHNFSLIGATTIKGISPAIFDLSHVARMGKTNAHTAHEQSKHSTSVSQPLKQRMQTYDIAYAGPRNRYTILTSEGPLIVHNCGYGMGWASFAAQLLTGFLGAPPVRYDKAFAKKLGITPDYVEHFLSWEENVKKMEDIPHTCSQLELAIHCVAAKKIIDIYRATAHPVVSFWAMCGDLLASSLYGGKEFRYKCVTFRKEEIELPNGMKLLYPNLRTVKDTKGRPQFVYGDDATKLYPGKITNNITQAVARIVMTDGMLRVSKRYPVVGTVHDEQIVCVPENESADALEWVLAQMTMEPKYLPGIPLNADGGTNKRYGLAKN